MELLDFLRALRVRWRWVVAGLLIGTVAATVVTLATTPQYEARTQLFVSTRQGADGTELYSGSSFSQQRVKSYIEVVTTPRVLDPVIAELGLTATAADLATRITVAAPLDTVLVDIAVRDPDGPRAAAIANAVSRSFMSVVESLEKVGDDPSPVRVSSVRDAAPPERPVAPSVPFNMVLGVLFGLLAGGAAAMVRQLLDTAVRGERDVTALVDAPVLGEIPFDRQAGTNPTLVRQPQSVRAEAFRSLRTNLQFVDAVCRLDALVVTSSVPQEGKSTTAVNLALACVDNGLTVCVVDADLRRPRIAHYLGLVDSVGLTTVLLGRIELDGALQRWGGGNLYVLTAGDTPPNPSEMLGAAVMSELIDQLRERFDLVIIDAPPLLPVTDAALLSTHAAGALLIAGAGKVHRDELRRSLRILDNAGARLLGVVLNLLPLSSRAAQGYYNYAADKPGSAARRLFRRPPDPGGESVDPAAAPVPQPVARTH
ncbi:polysaccharide biosynthesis tyrosine autokinase [Actinokineospora sp. NBRC 105648]|uniref:polysaccharide biosynthesis tyrosine autokinase n=1 Tax=Actinokineospora sp. NBRC 105648 TaxID=3032206 RepID=UPI0024A34315|nr:polysaccharide biosynthesis tyrosine autokinase [Actinokineospora sp. NBRC 105648]GLZ41882.1 chromosome partitioning protein [Actinokineospora sp. NBRC 105648]